MSPRCWPQCKESFAWIPPKTVPLPGDLTRSKRDSWSLGNSSVSSPPRFCGIHHLAASSIFHPCFPATPSSSPAHTGPSVTDEQPPSHALSRVTVSFLPYQHSTLTSSAFSFPSIPRFCRLHPDPRCKVNVSQRVRVDVSGGSSPPTQLLEKLMLQIPPLLKLPPSCLS